MGSKGRRALGGGKRILKEKPLQKGFSLSGSLPLSFHKESGEKIKSKGIDPSVGYADSTRNAREPIKTASFGFLMKIALVSPYAFSLTLKRTEKALHKETRIRDFAICGWRQGLCPLIPPTFEKVGSKLFVWVSADGGAQKILKGAETLKKFPPSLFYKGLFLIFA